MNEKKKHTQRKKDDRTLNIAGIVTLLLACVFWVLDKIFGGVE